MGLYGILLNSQLYYTINSCSFFVLI